MTDTTNKTKHKAGKDTTRCMRDVQDLAPSTFALPDDGRQTKHLQRQRKALAIGLARHADADGTQAYPAISTLSKPMGCSRRTIFRLLDDLRTLGFLQDGDIHGFRKTRVRTLDVQQMVGRPVPSSQAPVSSSENDLCHLHTSPVPSSRPPVSSSRAPVSSSGAPVPKQDGTQPSSDRPNKPTTNRPSDQRAGQVRSVSLSGKNDLTDQTEPDPCGKGRAARPAGA